MRFLVLSLLVVSNLIAAERVSFNFNEKASMSFARVLVEQDNLQDYVEYEGADRESLRALEKAQCRTDVYKPNWGEEPVKSSGNYVICDVYAESGVAQIRFVMDSEEIRVWGNKFQHHKSFAFRGELAKKLLLAMKINKDNHPSDENMRNDLQAFGDGTVLYGSGVLNGFGGGYFFNAVECSGTFLTNPKTGEVVKKYATSCSFPTFD